MAESDQEMCDVELGRVVIRDGANLQYIYLVESDGKRGFPIVIGDHEAREIERVLHQEEPPRPLTHQLAFQSIQALGASLQNVDIVDLRHNTFFAQITLQNDAGDVLAVVDARPSDAIALALRARCRIRASRSVIDQASTNGEKPE